MHLPERRLFLTHGFGKLFANIIYPEGRAAGKSGRQAGVEAAWLRGSLEKTLMLGKTEGKWRRG